MTRTRMDVWNLTHGEGDWPDALVAYERAVGLLRGLDPPTGQPVEPRGWRFLAAIHGIANAAGDADTSNPMWSNCQHGSWFFLPWHRMYLAAFELIVQDVLDDDGWSLPYWYALDPDDPATSILPPAFRDIAAGNDLHTTNRSFRANRGDPLPGGLAPSVTDALNADVFSTPAGTTTFGGGERSTPSFSGGERGLLEDAPHGAVHGLVGNDYNQAGEPVRRGWMGSFLTAGLDPVFWLHHANIDRMWQVWLDLDPANLNPTGDPAWFDTEFSFPAATGGDVTWSVGEVLDTVALGYEYEKTTAPRGVAPMPVPAGGGPDIGLGGVDMTNPLAPQTLGATPDVALSSTQPVPVELDQPVDFGLGAGADAGDGRVFLRIEGITGTIGAAVYDVYLNVPSGDSPSDHPELRAGSVSTFGMIEASMSDDVHDGSGITSVLDITRVRDVLANEGQWDPNRVNVTFEPVIPEPVDYQEGAELDSMAAIPADLRAARVAVVTT
ncbi:MAG: tyrosinase family protein [Acidimicrobiales bacterium]